MASSKYFSRRKNRIINLEKDGCELTEWGKMHEESLFAFHPLGFQIFLSPEEMTECDEYVKEDPYSVEEKIASEFHKRRIECTLELVQESLKKLKNKPRILDLGCGQGHITVRVKKRFPNAEITALDYSVSAIEYASNNFQGIDFSVGSAFDLPYISNYFDIVICNNLWEHVTNPFTLLDEIRKVLKPSGFLIVSTPSRYRFRNLIRVIMGKPVAFMSDYHVTEYTVGQMIEMLRFGGYSVIKIYSKRPNKTHVVIKTLQFLFYLIILATKSHHNLESTVFYLSQKQNK